MVRYGYGAAIALNYAATFSDTVRGVVLLAPSIFGGEMRRYFRRPWGMPTLNSHLARRAAANALVSGGLERFYSWKNERCEQAAKYVKRMKLTQGYDLALKRALTSTLKHSQSRTTTERDVNIINRSPPIQVLAVFVKNDEVVSC